MNKLKKNERGFSAIEGILVLVVVIVIAGVGYYVYKAKKNTTSTYNTAANASTTTKPIVKPKTITPSVTNYFTIKEWGVRAPYSGNLTLAYSISKDNSNNAVLGSQELATADPSHCSPAAGNAGYAGRYLPSDDIPTEGPPAETAQAFLSQDFKASNSNPPSYSKVGNYYYIYWTGQAACTYDASARTVQTQTTTDLENVVKNLQAIPN